jgi:uncharacterized membrane protein (TIGR02234 family)
MTGMSNSSTSPRATARQRRELAAALLLGAAGASLVLLALRQHWASVTTVVPRPLPSTEMALTGQDLTPAAAALAVAALASLAAVLATRRLARRITGLLSVLLGAGIALLAAARISVADVLAAAQRASGPAAGSGAGTAAGSVTAGQASGSGGSLAGFPAHVLLASSSWRGLMIGGALAIAVAGIWVAVRADRLPVMSGRYDRPASGRNQARDAGADLAAVARSTGSARRAPTCDPSTMWESLSAGEDPTSGPGA